MGTGLDSYNDVLTPDEARQILRIGRNSIYKLLAEGRIQAIRIGRKYVIPKNSLVQFINSIYDYCTDELRFYSNIERS